MDVQGAVREEAVVFGPARSLVGILTNPAAGAGDTALPGVVLLNSGIVHRVGPQRLYVKLARRLAAMGFVALRFDFSGIGDSNVRHDNLPFEKSAVSEIQDAMNYLRAERGIGQFVLAGLCSGAYFSLITACCDPRVVGAILVNSPGDEPETGDEWRSYFLTRKKARDIWKSALDPKAWMRVVTGKADYGDIIRVFRFPFRNRFGWDRAGMMPGAGPSQYAANLRSVAARGGRVLLVFSEGDPGLVYLHEVIGDQLQEILSSGKIGFQVIPQSDHTFTLLRNQERLFELVREWARECFVTAGRARQMTSG